MPLKTAGCGGVLLLVNRSRLSAVVVAAVLADAMRLFRLVTVRAFAESDGGQRVVRPALGRARLGVSSFWIGHRVVSLGKSSSQHKGTLSVLCVPCPDRT